MTDSVGFATFFKALAFAECCHPTGADADLPTWLQWFLSLPEPALRHGRLQRRGDGELAHRAALFALKICSLGGLLSLVLSAADPRRPVASRALPDWAAWLLSSELHLWVLYLWASACLDVGTLLALLGGGTTEPGAKLPRPPPQPRASLRRTRRRVFTRKHTPGRLHTKTERAWVTL